MRRRMVPSRSNLRRNRRCETTMNNQIAMSADPTALSRIPRMVSGSNQLSHTLTKPKNTETSTALRGTPWWVSLLSQAGPSPPRASE